MSDLDPTELARQLKEAVAGRLGSQGTADLEFYLLDQLTAGGIDQLQAVLEGAAEGAVECSRTDLDGGARFEILIPRWGVAVRGMVGDDLTSIDVGSTESTESLAGSPADPRHQWFYSRWESLLGIEDAVVEGLVASDRAVYLVALLESEVMNGGLGQYYTNTEGRWVDATLDLLSSIAAHETHAVLASARDVVQQESSPVEAWESRREELEELDERILRAGEDLAGLVADHFDID